MEDLPKEPRRIFPTLHIPGVTISEDANPPHQREIKPDPKKEKSRRVIARLLGF